VEHAVRSAYLRALVRLFGTRPPVARPDWQRGTYRLLFIRDDGIGDLVLSLEVMRAIALAAPGFTMDVLCSPQNARLARLLSFAGEVIVHQRGSLRRSLAIWRTLRHRKYDVVIDGRVAMTSVNPQTTSLILSTGAPWRVGLGGRHNSHVYTLPVIAPDATNIAEVTAALAIPFGIDVRDRDWRPHIPIAEAEREQATAAWRQAGAARPRVLVNYSAGTSERQWPAERYAPVMQRLRQRLPAASVMVVGAPAHASHVSEVASTIGASERTPGLEELIALVASADLVVTPDTSVAHFAAAFERLTLTYSAPTFRFFAPYRAPGRRVYSDDERSVAALPPERVVAALDEVIDMLGTTA
jgi:heptosyltransferase I